MSSSGPQDGEPGLRGLLRHLRVDFEPPAGPSSLRFVLAGIVAVGGSLLCDVALVALGKFLFPIVAHNAHLRPASYAKLTIIGVVVASLGWPIVTRISSSPRWLFLRLAVVISLVLLAPDAYLLYVGQPRRVVAVLVAMHLAIALVTYQALVRIAPVKAPRRRSSGHDRRRGSTSGHHGHHDHSHTRSSSHRSDEHRRH